MKTHKDGTSPMNGEVFVFGSNLGGYHGAGAAKAALNNFGAEMGKGHGHIGNSYALPTKNEFIDTLPLDTIKRFAGIFNEYAKENDALEFFLTRVGCVLAGYKDSDIAPMFALLDNVNYPEEWVQYITK